MLNSQVQGVAIQQRLRYSQSLKPCKSQRPIPNHQSSFCWIFSAAFDTVNHQILLSTLSSLGITGISTSLVWILSTPVGLSGWPGEGRYPKHINWSLGFLRDRFLDPSSSPHTLHSLGPIIQAHGFSYNCYADDTQLYLSFQPDDPTVSCTDLRLPGGHLGMDERTSPTAHLAKTELLVVPATPTLQRDFSIQLGTSIITPSTSVRNLGVIFWWPADLQRAHCKDCSILQVCATQHQKNQALPDRACCTTSCPGPLSFLGWTTAMLFWLDFHQPQSNLYKWFRMQRHDWSSMSPKEPMLHLSSSHCTGYQWQLASSSRHWCLHTERPQAQHPPTSTHYYEIYIPSRSLRSASERRLVGTITERLKIHSPEHSHSPFLDGGIIFPPLSGMLDPCQSSSNNWKLISFGTTWLHPKLVLKKKNFPFIFLSFPC